MSSTQTDVHSYFALASSVTMVGRSPKLIQCTIFLFKIKEQKEQKQFFSSLSSSLDSFPQQYCKHRILPQLLNAFEFGSAGSAVLGPLFKVSSIELAVGITFVTSLYLKCEMKWRVCHKKTYIGTFQASPFLAMHQGFCVLDVDLDVNF